MSARSFGSLMMVASCAGAALGCYLVSLRVASERAALEAVETRIVAAQRDMRVLQTEIGTRGRLAQLERWNVKVLALSAPSADQFLRGSFELARLTRPDQRNAIGAPVVLAAAPASSAPVGAPGTDPSAARPGGSPSSLLHDASLKSETREVPAIPTNAVPRPVGKKSTGQPVTAAKPALSQTVDIPGLAAAKLTAKPSPKKSVDKPIAAPPRPVTKPVRIAKTDPLAALPDAGAPPTIKD